MIASLASALVSRLMFNLREPRKYFASDVTTTMTAANGTVSTSSSTLLHTLTKVEDVDEPVIYESRNHQGGSFYDAVLCGYYESL